MSMIEAKLHPFKIKHGVTPPDAKHHRSLVFAMSQKFSTPLTRKTSDHSLTTRRPISGFSSNACRNIGL